MRQELTASFVLQEWSETYPTIFNILLIILIQLQYIYHKALQNHAPNISLFANMSVNVNIGEKQPKMYFLDINKTISGLPLKCILVLLFFNIYSTIIHSSQLSFFLLSFFLIWLPVWRQQHLWLFCRALTCISIDPCAPTRWYSSGHGLFIMAEWNTFSKSASALLLSASWMGKGQ